MNPVRSGLFLTGLCTPLLAAELPPAAPVPKSPYLSVVYRYADTLLEHGRDTYGPESTGLFLSALDRSKLQPLASRPPAPAGVRDGDRAGTSTGPLTGANLQHEQNLLRLLEVLSGLSGQPKYRNAANTAMTWLLNHAASQETALLPWGEHLCWDVMTDRAAAPGADLIHEFFRPWLLWDRCHDLAPEASRRYALALWEHQVANRNTGAFDRHARWDRHQTWDGHDFPRHAGFYIRTWAVAHDRTKDAVFLEAIGTMLRRFEGKRDAQTGWIESSTGQTTIWPPSNLSLGIDCHGASLRVPEPLASRLRAFAKREDEVFLALPHAPRDGGGFAVVLDEKAPQQAPERSTLWETRYGSHTTAQVGMMCVARYDNIGHKGYLDMIVAAADAYRDKLPGANSEVWPMTMGQAISLQLAAWRHTARQRYMDQARALADWAVEHFWAGQPLPRAGLGVEHYESVTGSDTLALALVELHLQILAITAVRCPANTADR